MHNMDIRIGLLKLNKKHVDLIAELNRRGYPELKQNRLSDYLHQRVTGPKADRVLALARIIINEWEKEAE